MVFTITESKDLRFCGLDESQVQQIWQQLKTRYHELNQQTTLKIYCVPKASLKEYAPEDDRKYNFENLPAGQFRQREQELRGMNEEEEQDEGNDMNGMFERINGNLDNLETRFAKNMDSGSQSSKASALDKEHF